MQTESMSETKPCKHCRQTIHKDASFCQICRNAQEKPKYGLIRTLGGLAAGLSLLAGVATYVLTNAPKLLRTQFGHEARVVVMDYSVDGAARISIQNAGDKALLVRSVEIAFPDFSDAYFSRSHNLNMMVAPGAVATRNPYTGEGAVTDHLDEMSYMKAGEGPGGWSPTPAELQELKDQRACYGISLHAPTESALTVVRAFYAQGGSELLTVPHEVRLRYFSGDAGREKLIELSAFAVLRHKSGDPECPAPWDRDAVRARAMDEAVSQ